MRKSRRGTLLYVVTGAVVSALAAMSLGPVAPAGAATDTTTVSYRGVAVTVPADWPVLEVGGATGCVRFDRHAVYLGDPKSSSCPADLSGHVEAVHVTEGGVTDARSPLATEGSGRTVTGGTAIHPDHVVSDASSPVRVIVTSGLQPSLAATIADSVRYDKAATRQMFKGFSGGSAAAASGRSAAAVPRTLSAPTSGTTQTRQQAAAPRARAGAPTFSGLGFDACTAPSLNAMNAWLASPYRAVNIYIGGASRGCSQLALNSSWVSSVVGMGWTLVPTYVGLQAPCGKRSNGDPYPNRISAASAATQGSSSADDAIAILNSLGLGVGSVVYFDMEAFDYTNSSCLAAVQTFLDAWTVRLHARDYLSGIYTSSNTMKATLVDKQGDATFHQPDDIWFARWNNSSATTGDPAIPDQFWPDHQRIHQYRGGHTETWGGVTINIDNDSLDADTAPGAPLAEGSFVKMAGASDVYRIAGGAPLRVSNWTHFGGPQPSAEVSRSRFKLLPTYPRTGTFLQAAGSGRVFRVASGAATYVPSWDAFGGPQPTTTVDPAALDLAGSGGVWNHLKSTAPSVRLTAPTTPFTTASRTRVTWQGAITSSAIKNYDVRYQKARWNGLFGSWTYLKNWQKTGASGKNKNLPRGTNYCFSVRAHNRAGATTSWTRARCLSRALDDRSLTPSKGWKQQKKSGYYDATYSTTARKGVTLTLRSARIARLAVVATTCASCGTVRVSVKGRYVGTVSLASPTTQRQQVLALPRFSRRVGNVVLKVTSANGKRVQIDGLALSRT